MRVLDLFCGRGGWSKPFARHNHECTGIDVANYGYPFKFIQADIFDWEPDQEYDVVLSSPPCTEFSWMKQLSCKTGYDERIGLDLVWRTFYLIEKIKPKYWLVENVKGLGDFLPKPNEIVRYGKAKNRKEAWIWSNIPKLGIIPPIEYKINWKGISSSAKLELSKRSEIPTELANEVHRVVCCN